MSISPTTVLQRFTALKDFTLAIINEDDVELKTSSYSYTGEWTEEKSDEWNGNIIGWDSDEEQLRQAAKKRVAVSRGLLNKMSVKSVEPEESGDMSQAAKAERFLRGLEERQIGQFIEQGYPRKKSILRWQTWNLKGCLDRFEKSLFEDDIWLVLWREKRANPEWKPPKFHVREVEGEMTSEDEKNMEWEELDIEDKEDDPGDYGEEDEEGGEDTGRTSSSEAGVG